MDYVLYVDLNVLKHCLWGVLWYFSSHCTGRKVAKNVPPRLHYSSQDPWEVDDEPQIYNRSQRNPSISSHWCRTVICFNQCYNDTSWFSLWTYLMDPNRIQVIATRMFVLHLVLLPLYRGKNKQCLAFPHIVCQIIQHSTQRSDGMATCQKSGFF